MTTIDEYLEKVEPKQKEALEHIRHLVKATVPEAEESISYGLAAFKYKGKPLVYFGGFKDHMSLFPTSKPTEILADKLMGYKVSKGTIQFTLEKPLPDELIKEILQVRLEDIR